MPELATRSRRPPGSAVSPTGACPTRTFAIRARPGSLRSRAAEKASSALLARAVTHTVEPPDVVITRPGSQPAGAVAWTEPAGCDSARATLITLSVPWSACGSRFWLVTYSHWPICSGLELLVLGQHRVEDLECDLPVQLEIVGAVDDGHPAPADLLIEPVPGHPRSRRDRATRPRGLVTHHASSAWLPARVRPRFPRVRALHSAGNRGMCAENLVSGI